ncbi:MAG: hypothetical protein LBG26_08620 [Treponema sp.]|nr:hypothetical protein [Treponema sp.]
MKKKYFIAVLVLTMAGAARAQTIIGRQSLRPYSLTNLQGTFAISRIASVEGRQYSNGVFQFVFTYNDGTPTDSFTLSDFKGTNANGVATYNTATISDGRNTYGGFSAVVTYSQGSYGGMIVLNIYRKSDFVTVISATLLE